MTFDHVVAITGAARGIGKATAEAFLATGAKVAIGDIDAELAAEVAAELSGRGAVIGGALDVTDEASFDRFLSEAEAQLGPLTVLVNNAGIMPTGLFLDEDPTMTARQIAINVNGVLIGSRLAARRFVERGGGHIVNVASLAGVTGEAGLATYCGTKHFVVGFTDSLHQELRERGVAVSTVLPGVVRTELSAGTHVPKWLEPVSTVDPQEVARGIVDAVSHRKAVVVVPWSLGALLKSMSLLPSRTRFGLMHLLRLDTAATTAVNSQAREAYHRRIAGD